MRDFNRPTDQRLAMMRNLATSFLWNGKIETTFAKAKDLQKYAEKILTKAINTYDDTVKVMKETKDSKGVKAQREVINDGPKRLAARRAIMSKLYVVEEQRAPKEKKDSFKARTKDIKYPLIEKIFNEYAPKFAKRKAELGIGGGYTRIVKLGKRQGDSTEMAMIELV